MNSNNFFQLIADFKKNIDWLNQVLKGGESDSVLIDGVLKPSISKDLADKWAAISAMVQGRVAFRTKAEMVPPSAGITLAEVWGDSEKSNNGLYGWTGSNWVKSSYDTVTAIAEQALRISKTGAFPNMLAEGNMPSPTGDSDYFHWYSTPGFFKPTMQELIDLGIEHECGPTGPERHDNYFEFYTTGDEGLTVKNGEWFTFVFYVRSKDGVYWGDVLSLYTYSTPQHNNNKLYPITNYTQINPNLRKYSVSGFIDYSEQGESPYAVRVKVEQQEGRTSDILFSGMSFYHGPVESGDVEDSAWWRPKIKSDIETMKRDIVNLKAGALENFILDGYLPDGKTKQVTVFSADKAPYIDVINNSVINNLGVNHAYKIETDVRNDVYFEVDVSASAGQTVIMSLYHHDKPGYWPDRVRFIALSSDRTNIGEYTANHVQYDSSTRQYYAIFKAPEQMGKVWFNVLYDGEHTTDARTTAFAYASTDMDVTKVPGDFGGPNNSGSSLRKDLSDLESKLDLTATSNLRFGELPEGQTSLNVVAGVADIKTFTNQVMNNLGINYGYFFDDKSRNDLYLAASNRGALKGQHIRCGFYLSDNPGWWPDGNVRIHLRDQNDKSIGSYPLEYEQIDNVTRYYYAYIKNVPQDVYSIWYNVCYEGVRSGTSAHLSGFELEISWTEIPEFNHHFGEVDFHKRIFREDINQLQDILGIGDSGTMNPKPKIIYPSCVFGVEGHTYSLYPSRIFNNYRESVGWKVAIHSVGNIAHQGEIINGDALGGYGGATEVCDLILSSQRKDRKKELTGYRSVSDKAGKTLNLLCIGDSLTYEGAHDPLVNMLERSGVTVNSLGTYKTRGQDGQPKWTEGRSSWEWADYVYIHTSLHDPSNGTDIVIVQPGAEDAHKGEFLANFFLRQATGGDPANDVKNGHIFDFRFYLDRNNFPDPDVVTLALGTNDLTSHGETIGTANSIEGLRIVHKSIRAACPSTKIAIVLNGYPDTYETGNDRARQYIQHVLDNYDKPSENTYVLPVYAHVHPRNSYMKLLGDKEPDGTAEVAGYDWVHCDPAGYAEYAAVTYAFCMNMIN